MDIEADNCKIVKTLHVDSVSSSFVSETEDTIHFPTKVKNKDDQIDADDNRKYKKPMQLIFGQKFKLPVWETPVQTMALNELSEFVVDKSELTKDVWKQLPVLASIPLIPRIGVNPREFVFSVLFSFQRDQNERCSSIRDQAMAV